MRRYGAHPAFCGETYWPQPVTDGAAKVSYPLDGQWTWRVAPEQLDPAYELPNFKLPHVGRPPIDMDSDEFKELFDMYFHKELIGQPISGSPGMGDNYDEASLRREANAMAANVMYQNRTSQLATLDGIRKHMTGQWKRINEEFKDKLGSPEHRQAVMTTRLKGILHFVDVFHETSIMPDSYKAVARYIADNINVDPRSRRDRREKKSRKLERTDFGRLQVPMSYNNISFYGETKTTEAFFAEMSGTYVAHAELIMARSLSFTTSDHTKKFKPDLMVVGQHGKGKSHLTAELADELIPGTWARRSEVSAKADNQPRNAHLNVQCMIWEELPGAVVGFDQKQYSHHAKAGSTDAAATGQAAAMRDGQTTGEKVYDRLERDPEDGSWHTERVRMQAKIWNLACTNVPKDRIPENGRSRWIVMTYQHGARDDHDLLHCQAAARANPDRDMVQQWRQLRTRRNQALVYVLNLWVYLGIIPPVETTVTDTVLLQILKKGKEYGLDACQNIRESERIKLAVEASEAMSHAVSVEFDSDMYSDEQDDFSEMTIDGEKRSNMTLWMKLLRAALRAHTTLEQMVFMLSGLGPHTFEDPVGPAVIDAINAYYPTGISKEKKTQAQAQPRARHVSADAIGSGSSEDGKEEKETKDGKQSSKSKESKQQSIQDGFQRQGQQAAAADGEEPVQSHYIVVEKDWKDESKFASSEQRAFQIAKIIKNSMRRDTSSDHIAAWILKQMEQMALPDGAKDARDACPNIVVSDGKLKIARSLLANNKAGRLNSAIKHVLQRCVTEKKTFIMGTTKRERPYIFQTLDVDPKATKKRLEVPNPTQLPPEVFEFAQRFLALHSDSSQTHETQVQLGLQEELKTRRRLVKSIRIDVDADDHAAKLRLEQFPDCFDLLKALKLGEFDAAQPFLIPSTYNKIIKSYAQFARQSNYPPPLQGKDHHAAYSVAMSELKETTNSAATQQSPRKRKRVEATRTEFNAMLERSAVDKRRRMDKESQSIPRLESPSGHQMDEKHESPTEPQRSRNEITFEESRHALTSPVSSIVRSASLPSNGPPVTRTLPPPVPRQRTLFHVGIRNRQHHQQRRGRRDGEPEEAEDVTDAEAEAEDRAVPAEPGFDSSTMNFAAFNREIEARRLQAASRTSVLGSLMRQADEEHNGQETEEKGEGDENTTAMPEGEDGAEGDGEAELAQELKELQESDSSDSSVSAPEGEGAPPVRSRSRRLQRLGGTASRSPSPVLALDDDEVPQPAPESVAEPESERMAESMAVEPEPEPMQALPLPVSTPAIPEAPVRPRLTFSFLRARPRAPVQTTE